MSFNVHQQERPVFPQQTYSTVDPARTAASVNTPQGDWNQGITTSSDGMIEVITLESNSPAFKLQDSSTEASASSDPGLLISLESAEENHAQGAVMKMSGQSEEAGASTSSCTSEAKLSWAALSTMEKGALGFSIGFAVIVLAGFAATLSTIHKNEPSHQAAVYTMVAGTIGFVLSSTFLRISQCCSEQAHGELREPSALA